MKIVEDKNNNENIDIILTSNEDLNDQTIIYFYISLESVDSGVDIGEMCILWDKNNDVSTHAQAYNSKKMLT